MSTHPYRLFLLAYTFVLFLISCNENWDDYYSVSVIRSEKIEVYSGKITNFIQETAELSVISSIFDEQGVYDGISDLKEYTFFVCTNEKIVDHADIDPTKIAKNLIADIAVSPDKLNDGLGITTRLNKNIWVKKTEAGEILLNNLIVTKIVRATNGYIYYVDGLIQTLPSLYEFFEQLGEDYTIFKSLVKKYEIEEFDATLSIPIAVDDQGKTVYDTVMTRRNELIDRYTEGGFKKWDMFSENYLSTFFVPSNDIITQAIEEALTNIPVWLNREATEIDRDKFEEWIVRACFVNSRLGSETVASTAKEDFYCIDGYMQTINVAQDVKNYVPVDPAVWRPSVQRVNTQNPVELSNGVAYYLTSLKIPNHVVIYRVKARFYELWGAMTDVQQKQYFRWVNYKDQLIVNDAQSSFTLTETMPTMYYHVLTAIPTEQAMEDSLVCSVTYDGVLYNSKTKKLAEVYLPAGEYSLRMGFKHSLHYSIDIYFNDDLLVENMMLYAQGSNFHFDRGSVSDLDYYGNSSIGFPEHYDWRDWIEKDEKAVAYDTDGYQVAVVNIPTDGNFTITIDSKDLSYLYDDTNGRSKNNVTQLMMYHWCLRPTIRNY